MKVAKADCGIRFRLRDPKSTSTSPIICFIEYDSKPNINSIGKAIHADLENI